MKQAEKGRGAGYTVLEAIIFLAVSAAMLVSAMAFISGRQNRTEFSSAIRDFESSMNDIANDVSNGYYANTTSDGRRISCQVTGSGVTADVAVRAATNDTQGGNQGCIFIGKSVIFRPTTYTEGQYITTGLVGKQYKNGSVASGEAETYTDSGVRAMIRRTGVTPTDLTPSSLGIVRMNGGVTFGCAFYSTGPDPVAHPCSNPTGITLISTLAFMTTFQAATVSDEENRAGSVSVNLVVRPQGLVNKNQRQSLSDTAAVLNGIRDTGVGANAVINPAGGVFVCLQSNGTRQHALVAIGGERSRFSTSTQVLEGNC